MIGSISVQVCYEDQQEELYTPSCGWRYMQVPACWVGTDSKRSVWTDRRYTSCSRHQLQQIPALQETLKRYAEVFENELGEIKGMEARIDVN